MIKLLRIDHRLLHGQVAFSWSKQLGTDCILLAGVTDKYKLFIVVESVEDADRLARALDIKEINLGGTKPTDDRHVISTAVYVSDNDEKILKDLMNDGFYVFTQMVPSDKRVNTKDLLK